MPVVILQLCATMWCIDKHPAFKYYMITILSGIMFILMLESMFEQTFIGRILSTASIIQAEHLLHRFARFNKSTLGIIFVLKLGYATGRVLYEFKDSTEVLIQLEDFFNLIALTSFYVYTLYIDD